MVKILKQDAEKVFEILDKPNCLGKLMAEITADQGINFAVNLAYIGAKDLNYLYGMLCMYFIVKEATRREQVEGLEELYKMGGGENSA